MSNLMVDTIKVITGLAENAIHRKGSTSKCCRVVTLDPKNLFNSTIWNLVRESFIACKYFTAVVDKRK